MTFFDYLVCCTLSGHRREPTYRRDTAALRCPFTYIPVGAQKRSAEMFEATIPSRPEGGNWRLTSNEQHRHDSSRLRAGHTVAGARKLRSLSTSAQQGSCYLFGLRGGLQPQSTCLPALRSAPSAAPLAGDRRIRPCTHICAEAVSDLHQASTSLFWRIRALPYAHRHARPHTPVEVSESAATDRTAR